MRSYPYNIYPENPAGGYHPPFSVSVSALSEMDALKTLKEEYDLGSSLIKVKPGTVNEIGEGAIT